MANTSSITSFIMGFVFSSVIMRMVSRLLVQSRLKEWAANNGFMSATISFLRILVFQIICLLLLPAIFDVNGIWISIVVAEFLAVSVTATLIIKNRKKYQYA